LTRTHHYFQLFSEHHTQSEEIMTIYFKFKESVKQINMSGK